MQTVCPQCGIVGLAINQQTKMCPRCTETYHVGQELAFHGMLETERDALRQQNSRLKRKYGLKSERHHALPDLSEAEY